MKNRYLQFLFREKDYTSRTIGCTPTPLCRKTMKECPVYKGLVDIKLLPVVDDPDTNYVNQLQYFHAVIVTFPAHLDSALQRRLCNKYCTMCQQCGKGIKTR